MEKRLFLKTRRNNWSATMMKTEKDLNINIAFFIYSLEWKMRKGMCGTKVFVNDEIYVSKYLIYLYIGSQFGKNFELRY